MAPNRSKSRYAIKECSTCGSWYTKECCSIGNLNDQIIVPVPDSSQHCAVCGTPVDGPYCHGCTLIRMKFEKDLFAYCVDNGVFQNFQDTSESSNDNTNVVNAPREPSVVDQDPGVNFPQNPPQIDHNCCYECGDSLNGIFCQKCICEFCGKGAHFGYNCPPKDPIISEPEPCYNQNSDCFPHDLQTFPQQYLCCAYCGGPHHDYQCQPINETCYEPNPSYDYSGFDHPQPPQDSVDHQGILQVLNKMEEKFEEIIRDGRKKIEDMSIEEMMHEQQLVDREIKGIINDLGYKRFRGEEIDEEYERDCEIRIRKLKQDFNIWGSEVRKKEKAYEDEKYAAACRYMLSITCDDEDDYIPSGDIIARYSTSITHGLNDRVLCENIVPIPSEFEGISDDTSDVPTCDNNCVNVESDLLESLINRDTSIVYSSKIDPILEEFADELAHIAPIPPGIDGRRGLISDISRSLTFYSGEISRKLSFNEGLTLLSLSSYFRFLYFCPSSTIPVVDLDLPLEEADVPSFSDNSILRGIESDRDSGEDTTSIDDLPLDDSMIFSEYESFTFDDEPVMEEELSFEKITQVYFLLRVIALKDNPAPSSDVMTKSSSTSLNSFLEETNTFDNSSPEPETFYFDLEEKSSGSTTTHSDYSLPDYEAFYSDDDHIEEKSSGSTTTHADFSQYDSFIFDLSINPFPPADRSDFYHEEFADELAHIISPPEYDHFCFKIEPELGNLTMDVVEDIFPTREPRVHVPNVLPTHPTLHLDLDFILLSEPLFAYIVWIFLPFLTYPVAHPYLLSCGNEDTIFDPGISIYHSFMPDVSSSSRELFIIQCLYQTTDKRSD
ncbi:hypothetical protein Tco_0598704 [Tanacetum coccineum]